MNSLNKLSSIIIKHTVLAIALTCTSVGQTNILGAPVKAPRPHNLYSNVQRPNQLQWEYNADKDVLPGNAPVKPRKPDCMHNQLTYDDSEDEYINSIMPRKLTYDNSEDEYTVTNSTTYQDIRHKLYRNVEMPRKLTYDDSEDEYINSIMPRKLTYDNSEN